MYYKHSLSESQLKILAKRAWFWHVAPHNNINHSKRVEYIKVDKQTRNFAKEKWRTSKVVVLYSVTRSDLEQ